MIRCVVAIDEKRGLANDEGIPWDLPSDKKFYVDQIRKGIIIMGLGTYHELKAPMHNRTNYVATTSQQSLGGCFVAVSDVPKFFAEHTGKVIQNIGGATLFSSTLQFADELIITQLQADFHCTKFFPEYKDAFELVEESKPITENGVAFSFQTWHHK